jgi:ketosteroid isomerase-like protein
MMKRLAVLALVVFARTASAQDARATLRAADSAWARSYATNDTVLARALFASDLVVTSGNGTLKDKEGEVADVRPYPGAKTNFFRTSDVAIRAYGNAGVVTGLAEWEFEQNGRTSSARRRYTAVYIRGGSLGWQMTALHIGPAPAKP